MALIFYNGSMSCGKSAAIIMFARNFKLYPENLLVGLPDLSSLGLEKNTIESRAFTEPLNIDIVLKDNWYDEINNDVKFFLIDEAQFLKKEDVRRLKELSERIEVICYGIQKDFLHKDFVGAAELLKRADKVIYLLSPCEACRSAYSEHNIRVDRRGNIIMEGNQKVLKSKVKYVPVCKGCFKKKVAEIQK